jgi:hypothetical protein
MRLSTTGTIKARLLIACLIVTMVAATAPAEAQRAPRGKTTAVRAPRPTFTTLQQLSAATGGDIANLPRLLRAGRVASQLDRVCAVAGENAVTCSTVDDIERFLELAPEDGKLMRLGLNDIMGGIGLPATDQTLFLCLGGGPQVGRTQFGSLPGTGGGLATPSRMQPGGAPRGPRAFTASAGASVPSHVPSSADRSAMSGRCASGLRTGSFGGGRRGTRAEANAVSGAVGFMDRATSQCRDETSPIADDADGTGIPDSTGSSPTDSTPPATDSTPPATPASAPTSGPTGNAGEQAVSNVNMWLGLWAGGTELVAAIGTGNIAGAILAVGGLVGNADQLAGDGTATDSTSGAAQAVGNASTVTSLVVTVATQGGAIVGAGTAIAAVGVASGTLALVVPATRWADEKSGFGDWAVNKAVGWKENSAEYRQQYGLDSKRPAPGVDGRMTCDEARAAWERFKAYCSQAGNNWQTYDCAKFIARMNRCSDPGVVNPGPEGDYVCRGKATERDKAIAQCEQARRKHDLIARPTGAARASCRDSVDGWVSLRANAMAILHDHCTKVDGGEDGFSCPAPPRAGGEGGAPPPAPRPLRPRGT